MAMGDTPASPLHDLDRSPSPLQMATMVIGVVLIVVGIYMMLQIFFTVLATINDPSGVEGIVDKWDAALQGDSPIVDVNLPEWIKDENTPASTGGNVSIDLVRPLAIIVLLVLLGVLVRIAIGITRIGVKMVQPHADLLKQLVRALKPGAPAKSGDQ